MSGGDQSTPVINKRTEENEIVKIMQTLFEIQNNKFDEKFSDLKSDINEIKRQNCNFDERINAVSYTHLSNTNITTWHNFC